MIHCSIRVFSFSYWWEKFKFEYIYFGFAICRWVGAQQMPSNKVLRPGLKTKISVVKDIYKLSQKMHQRNIQKWPACQRSKVVQGGPKGFKMVNLDVLTIWDPFGPVWTLLDHFRQKSICWPIRTKLGLAELLMNKGSFFVWNGPKGPDGLKRVPNG